MVALVCKLVVAGWDALSLIDVRGSTAFVVWLCGCNLRCPFCHNWRIADGDPSLCTELGINEIEPALETARRLDDYLHVTGGEPLLQADALKHLLERAKSSYGYRASLDSNLTLPENLSKVVDLLDHVATDMKLPEMYGLPLDVAEKLFERYLESLRIVADHGIVVELRIPVARNVPVERYVRIFERVSRYLSATRFYVVLNPLRGEPLVNPRDREWCSIYCNPSDDVVETLRRSLGL